MEHRYHQRVPVDLKMLIFQSGLPVATGTIRDASRVGFFVETEFSEFRPHQHLQFQFRLAGEAARDPHCVTAYISRMSRDGVGLEVDEADKAACDALNCLVSDSSRVTGHPRMHSLCAA